MAIGAVTSAGEITGFSRSGPTYDGRIKPDLVAMGSGVYIASYHTGGYRYGSGTSYSAPLSAGAAALLLEAHPQWSPMDLADAMKGSADRSQNPDTLYGWGIFDTFRAAGLLIMDSIAPIIVVVGDSIDIPVSVMGPDDTTVVEFTSENLPSTAELISTGNHTAALRYMGKSEDIGSRTVRIIASVGDTSTAQEVSFSVVSPAYSGEVVVAGPNPFDDSLTIFIGTDAGEPEEISVYTVNGEKVWDKFDDIYNSGTRTVVWKGVNNSGTRVGSGVYLVLVRTGKIVEKIKVFRK
jgi:hypothetical protein